MMSELLSVARGEKPAALKLTGGRVFNAFSGEFLATDLFIHQGRIIGFSARQAVREINLEGLYLLPGFIDAHLHLESSYLLPGELARLLLPCGTTTLICDPHEIANVLGKEGLEYLLCEAKRTALSIFFTAPSCVPASPLETPGATLGAEEVAEILKWPEVLGLAEVMNFPGACTGEPGLMAKIQAAKLLGKIVDGHAPSLSGPSLEAYRLAGPASDHECISLREAEEKLRLGFQIFIRRGTAANNLPALLPLVRPENFPFFSFASDDLSAREILRHGHLNRVLKEAVSLGLEPVIAIRLATLSPALYFGLRDRGALFPGARADLVAVEDLRDFKPKLVFSQGRLVAKEGKFLGERPSPGPAPSHPVKIPDRLDLKVPYQGGKIRVIGLVPGEIITDELILDPTVKEGLVVADPERDLAKIVCVERHHGSHRLALGFVRGFGLKEGALGSTVAHDSHQLLLVGMEDEDLEIAARRIKELGGGQVVVRKKEILAELALPIGGLLSPLSAEEVVAALEKLQEAARSLGARPEDPFMTLSFLALPVIPKLKITDQGLVDVEKFTWVDLFL